MQINDINSINDEAGLIFIQRLNLFGNFVDL